MCSSLAVPNALPRRRQPAPNLHANVPEAAATDQDEDSHHVQDLLSSASAAAANRPTAASQISALAAASLRRASPPDSPPLKASQQPKPLPARAALPSVPSQLRPVVDLLLAKLNKLAAQSATIQARRR